MYYFAKDGPIAGGVTGWCEDVVDIPLGVGLQSRLEDPIRCLFPFIGREGEFLTGGGSEFYIMESEGYLSKKESVKDISLQMPEDHVRTILITVNDYVVDHTGRILLEPSEKENLLSDLDKRRRDLSRRAYEKAFLPWSAFASSKRGQRITLLPDASVPIHLVELTIRSNNGMKKSLPFQVDNLSICEGGVESSAILLEDHKTSGFFAYRRLRSFGQSEVHIIPEFVAFNGSSENTIVIKQPQSNHVVIEPESIAPLNRDHLKRLIIMIEVLDLSGSTAPIQVDELGMRICVVKSNKTGTPLGSIAIQTVVGGKDSRLVIKVGAVTFGGKERISEDTNTRDKKIDTLSDDFLRFRVRWTELKISLSDTLLSQEPEMIREKGTSKVSKNIHDMAFIQIVFCNLTIGEYYLVLILNNFVF